MLDNNASLSCSLIFGGISFVIFVEQKHSAVERSKRMGVSV
jgi:hypothetical protein